MREGLKCILNILNALDDDEERKNTVMAFLDSTQVNGFVSGLDVLEEIYNSDDLNEENMDLLVEILDGHFGIDEEFFLNDDRECENGCCGPNRN